MIFLRGIGCIFIHPKCIPNAMLCIHSGQKKSNRNESLYNLMPLMCLHESIDFTAVYYESMVADTYLKLYVSNVCDSRNNCLYIDKTIKLFAVTRIGDKSKAKSNKVEKRNDFRRQL